MNQQREQEALLAVQREQELRKQAAQEKKEPPQNSDFRQLIGEMCGTKVYEEPKQNMEDMMLELLDICREKELYCMHNDVDDLIESALNSRLLSINLKSLRLDKEKHKVKNIVEQPTTFIAIIPDLPTKEPEYSLSMRDEHLSTISETKSDKVIKSSVKNLVLIPSESEVTSDNESECDVPLNDESSPIFTTFSKLLFDCNNDFTSSDDKSLSNEDVSMENLKIYSNPLVDDEESISPKKDPHYFNAESNLLESLLNRDTLIDSSPKFDFLLEEFSESAIASLMFLGSVRLTPTKCRTRITESMQNFRVIHKMSSISNTSQTSPVIAIAPDLPTKKPEYSLSMGDEHLNTIPKTESNEVIKSSAENLVTIPSESEVTSDNECDVLVNDESSPIFTTFSNALFDCNDDFTSSDDKSLSNVDVPIENFKIYSNSLFDGEESISTKIDPHYFNAESNLLESLLNRDTLIDSSPKFDFLLEEFSGELAHIDPILLRIEEADFDLDDSQIEEIDVFLDTDDLMPPGSENDDYDSEGDIYFLEELLSDDTYFLEILFDFKPDTGVLTAKVVDDISEHHVLMPKVLPTQPAVCPNIDPLL
nr:hypothetical protein [Tanacetum cinerariifolium]